MSHGSMRGRIVDLHRREIYPSEVAWRNGRITHITRVASAPERYLLPGFVDSHIHIESSMLVPSEFARQAIRHGTVATVSDPHEIANVLGMDGIEFMLRDAARCPVKIRFGAPSCVPATRFETAGAELDAEAVQQLLLDSRIGYLSEMMNFVGVLQEAGDVMRKITAARERGKPIDGHAPGLRGDAARRYFAAGITTDHECTSLAEAREKAALGVSIQIREGSAARNYDALHPLIDEVPDQCMFCTDDLHPDDLQQGHINCLIKRAWADGHDRFDVLRMASLNPVLHYGLDVGLLRVGDAADWLVVESLDELTIQQVIINGVSVEAASHSSHALPCADTSIPMICGEKHPRDFRIPATSTNVRVITISDGELRTGQEVVPAHIEEGAVVADPTRDVMLISVTNRYADAPVAMGLVHGFGLQRGAIASSVAHDCHNIVAVGISAAELCSATNAVIHMRGGLAAVEGAIQHVLPLPVAGLMSLADGSEVAALYSQLSAFAGHLGSTLHAPFMTLSFMALLVIPSLKLSDRGLFDGERFEFVPLCVV